MSRAWQPDGMVEGQLKLTHRRRRGSHGEMCAAREALKLVGAVRIAR
jgi:hypothetical protein